MKKILFSFALLIASLSGFSQVFLIDSKSITVPRHADFAAISAAIPTPTNGQLVYNNQFNVFLYYNGTSWVSFPSSSGTQPWTISGNDIKYNTGNVGIGIGSATSTATLDVQRASGTLTTPHLSLGITGTIQTNQIVSRYYNGSSGTGGIFQTVIPNTSIANALVKWEHRTSGNFPLPMMTLSGAGNLTINGSSTIFGDETILNSSTVNGNSITGGFTQLGFNAPLIKTSLIYFLTSSSALSSSIPHGLDAEKIVSFKVIINSGVMGYVTDNNSGTGLQFGSSFDTNFITVSRSSTNGSALAGKQGTIFITYTD
jgi:hypothetical protein